MQPSGSLSALVEPSKSDQREERLAYSIVVPVYDEEQSLPILYEQLTTQLQALGQPYEIIFVDDGSRDGSFKVLQELHRQDQAVKVIRFRRNFGKTPALTAGFQRCRGDVIFTLDGDLLMILRRFRLFWQSWMKAMIWYQAGSSRAMIPSARRCPRNSLIRRWPGQPASPCTI